MLLTVELRSPQTLGSAGLPTCRSPVAEFQNSSFVGAHPSPFPANLCAGQAAVNKRIAFWARAGRAETRPSLGTVASHAGCANSLIPDNVVRLKSSAAEWYANPPTLLRSGLPTAVAAGAVAHSGENHPRAQVEMPKVHRCAHTSSKTRFANLLRSHPPEHFRSGAAPTCRAIKLMTSRQGLHAVVPCVSLRVGSDTPTRLTRPCSDRAPVSLPGT